MSGHKRLLESMGQQDLFAARQARDRGLTRTRTHNSEWLAEAMRLLPAMKLDFHEVTGESIRLWLLTNGLQAPASPHAWGALTNAAVRAKLIEDTGRVVQMAVKKSHARRTPLWRFR